ncbi:MAG: aminodeoxychorismate/anthranilate synthase component II [Myxococcota bacterium]
MPRLLLVDAYDSFTHNLAQGFGALGVDVSVVRCDAIDAAGIAARAPDLVVFGPGPGEPDDAGCAVPAIRALCGRIPLLGVCLGHQALARAFGGAIVRHRPVHGHATPVRHDGTGLFAGVPPAAPMGRYHSLGVDPASVPSCLRVTARSDDGVVMGLAHRTAPAWGVQFHPESVLSGVAGVAVMRAFVAAGAAAISPRRRSFPPAPGPG